MNQRMWSVIGAVIAAAAGGAAWGQRARGDWATKDDGWIPGTFRAAAVAPHPQGLQALVVAAPRPGGGSSPDPRATLIEPSGVRPLPGLRWSPLKAAIVGRGPARGVYTGGDGASFPAVIFRWRDGEWSELPPLSNGLFDMTAADLGNGERLYVAGMLWSFGLRGVGVWDGETWQPVGASPASFVSVVRAVEIGGAQRLAIGGSQFDGGPNLSNVAVWDGAVWQRFPANGLAKVRGIASLPTGPGGTGELYVGGEPVIPVEDPAVVLRWDGAAWQAVATASEVGSVVSLEAVPSGSGVPSLVTHAAGGARIYDGRSWRFVVGGTDASAFSCRNGEYGVIGIAEQRSQAFRISAMEPDGQRLVAGGLPASSPFFLTRLDSGEIFAGGNFFNRAFATWTRGSWMLPYEGGPETPWPFWPEQGARDVVRWQASNRRSVDLYVAGKFYLRPSATQEYLARFDGRAWGLIGSPDATATALEVFDDGAGERLYLGGIFEHVGGTPARGLATYDGSTWMPADGLSGRVSSMRVYDDGDGPALWVTGHLSTSTERDVGIVRKRRGQPWEVISSWGGDGVRFTVLDLGGGAELYTTGGAVHRWDSAKRGFVLLGPEWGYGSAGGARGVDVVEVRTARGATKRALVAGGWIDAAAIETTAAVFDGEIWRPFIETPGYALALVASPDRTEAFLGGDFSNQAAGTYAGFTRLTNITITCDGDADYDGAVGVGDIALVLGEFGQAQSWGYWPMPPPLAYAGDLNFDGRVDFADLTIVLSRFGQVCPE